PLPGDPIVGYVTRGRGVSIHRADCPNLQHLAGEERRVSVSWDTARSACYPVAVEISGMDRPGLLADVLSVISDTRTNVLSVAARGDRNKRAAIELVLEIRNLDQLQYLTRRILKVRDVFSVHRVTETGRQRDAARS
ncbi:MAG: ACT domain-containing protein, partial [Bacillota bacterium]